MKTSRILLVSNGFGEAAILECIAREIAAADPSATLSHLRLVGRAPAGAWPPEVGPQADMPSGGLVTYWNFRNLWRDLRAGLAAITLRQFAYIRRHRTEFDVVVAVGDVYCLAVCLLFARLPAIFVATAKSEFVAPHSALESAIARRAAVTFARDEPTATALLRRGVNARSAGNVMMDDVQSSDLALPVDASALHIAVLPGSRADAPANAESAARKLDRIAAESGRAVQAFVAIAPSADPLAIAQAVRRAGISVESTGADRGIVARGSERGVDLLFVRGGFGDVLRASDIVLGQAGTGNEQAAGLGKPVIAEAEAGRNPESVGWYRMRQKRLLGDALLVLAADDAVFAHGVVALVGDPARMAAMGAAGRERMGGTGAAAVIADATLSLARSRV